MSDLQHLCLTKVHFLYAKPQSHKQHYVVIRIAIPGIDLRFVQMQTRWQCDAPCSVYWLWLPSTKPTYSGSLPFQAMSLCTVNLVRDFLFVFAFLWPMDVCYTTFSIDKTRERCKISTSSGSHQTHNSSTVCFTTLFTFFTNKENSHNVVIFT